MKDCNHTVEQSCLKGDECAQCLRDDADTVNAAHDLAIVMAYEAMRICLGLPTDKHKAKDVLLWMTLMANEIEAVEKEVVVKSEH